MKINIKTSLIHLLLLLVAIGSVIFFVLNYKNSAPTDMLFHISRLQGLDNYFRSPVNFIPFHNSGKIVNIMYPPLTLLPLIITKIFTSDLYIRYIIGWMYVAIISTYISFYSMKKITGSTFTSVIFAILMTFSVSKFNYMFEHGAISNVFALGFIPLVIWGFKEVVFGNKEKFYILAIGLSLILMTHILTMLIVCIFLVVAYFVSFIFKRVSKRRFQYQVYTLFAFLLLTLVVTLPLIEQYKSHSLTSANIIWNIHGYSIWNYFNISLNNGNFLGLFNTIALIFCFIICLKMSKFDLTIFISSLVMLIFVFDFIPWNILKHTFLVQLQYPTPRITSLINVLINYLFAKYVFKFKFWKTNSFKYIVTICIIVIYISLSWNLGIKSYNRAVNGAKNNNREIQQLFTSKTLSLSANEASNFYDNADYTNIGYKKYSTKLKTYFTINDKIINKQVMVNESEISVNLKTNQKNEKLITPISIYKGLEVTRNKQIIKPEFSKYKTLQINLLANQQNNIKIKYKWTFLARFSQIISLCSWILIFYIAKIKTKLHK